MIDKLEMFITLARIGHFGRAAEESGVTQPTLSAAIKQLEEQLGVMLVLRGSRFQRLTPEGQRVLEWARRIVGDARQMREEMRFATEGLSGNVRIAVIPTALAMVADLTVPMRQRHPNVYFQIVSRTSTAIASMLEDGEADCGITYMDGALPERIVAVPLYEEAYNLLTPEHGALANEQSVSWEQVATVPLGLLTPDMQNRKIINEYLSANAKDVRPVVESNSIIVLTIHVQRGECSAIIPRQMERMLENAEGVRIIPITGAEPGHGVGFIAQKRDPDTPVMSELIEMARKIAA